MAIEVVFEFKDEHGMVRTGKWPIRAPGTVATNFLAN